MTEAEGERMPGLAWAEAEVHDSELHLALTTDAPRGWAARFRQLVTRLGADGERRWGRISVSRRELKVADMVEGGEADLRHLLESALQQVNADFAADDEERDAESSPERRRDARLTEAFRGFAHGA